GEHLAPQMTRERPPQFWVSATQCFFGSIGVAALTFVCFWLQVNVATAGFAFLILVALLSLKGTFIGSVALSIAAAACLAYFFAPPTFSFLVDVPQDVLALAAFLTTSIIVTGLMARVRELADRSSTDIEDRKRAAEALRESEEQWREV